MHRRGVNGAMERSMDFKFLEYYNQPGQYDSGMLHY